MYNKKNLGTILKVKKVKRNAIIYIAKRHTVMKLQLSQLDIFSLNMKL